jgi:methyl-accepting chemotaxis protein
MGLKDVLDANQVPLPEDFDERLKLVMMGLRKDPGFDAALATYRTQAGGGDADPPPIQFDSEDWMGPRVRWFLDAITSPYARVMLKGLFMVIFFVSYLEQLPVFGSILSTGLDLLVTGNKALTKTIQRTIPAVMGLLPIPYASLVGMMMAAAYGMIVWPLIAMIALSRQEFAVAIESYLRAIPPPFGDTIADLFMEANKLGAKLDEKRRKVANDITTALGTIANVIQETYDRVQQGINKVSSRVTAVADKARQFKDTAQTQVSQLKDTAQAQVSQLKDTAQAQVSQLKDTAQAQVSQLKDTAQTQVSQLKDTAQTQVKDAPIAQNIQKLSNKITNVAKKPRASFEPTPVTGQGRKRLSTKRRKKNKWTSTRRIRFATR